MCRIETLPSSSPKEKASPRKKPFFSLLIAPFRTVRCKNPLMCTAPRSARPVARRQAAESPVASQTQLDPTCTQSKLFFNTLKRNAEEPGRTEISAASWWLPKVTMGTADPPNPRHHQAGRLGCCSFYPSKENSAHQVAQREGASATQTGEGSARSCADIRWNATKLPSVR